VKSYYDKPLTDGGPSRSAELDQIGPAFYEKVWQWVINHTDVRITHKGVTCRYTLAEFEAAETSEQHATDVTAASQAIEPTAAVNHTAGHAESLLALKGSLRQRLKKEAHQPRATTSSSPLHQDTRTTEHDAQNTAVAPKHINRAPRVALTTAGKGETIFDDAPSSLTAPRLFASQSRIWHALTGHGIDLKKVPTMEFVLLSLIASHGEGGVTQPDLTIMSGQDKRSVPKRTDELCRKGYIEKRPVQSGKLRTSLCVHTKFVTDDHFLTSGKVEDVFQYKKFVVSGFVHLLYNTLKDAGVVPTRDIRTRLVRDWPLSVCSANSRQNVPISTWNKRAVQGALIRLNQSGMIKRFRARRQDSEDNWLTCIEVLREPRPEDHDNLKFRRQVTFDEAEEGQSDEEIDGGTTMKDLEVDILNNSPEEAEDGEEDGGRIPPQWVPERLLANILHEIITMGGPDGWDAGVLRDRIVGKFWRRPMESYLTRLTDDWEATQLPHLRHLALIRDTRNTQEKKFVHYVYRTYSNFQKAVEAGEVIWAGVSKPASKQPSTSKGGRPKKVGPRHSVDTWGFRAVEEHHFFNKDGSGSLSDCRSAITHRREYGPRWDTSILDDIGYQKVEIYKPERPTGKKGTKSKAQSKLSFSSLASPSTPVRSDRIADAATDGEDVGATPPATVMGLPKRKYDSGLLTIDQRIALGLKPKGRLSKFVEDQVKEHREKSGDPLSVPDSIVLDRPTGKPTPVKSVPLMSKEERIAAGLPPRGRLGQKIEDEIRVQRGLPKSVEKVKRPRKSRPSNEPALLSKEQRIKLGIIPHGRLPQSLIEGLREEREFDISHDESKVIPAYKEAVKNNKSKPDITRLIDQARLLTMQEFDPDRTLNNSDATFLVEDEETAEVDTGPATPSLEKRKANDDLTSLSSKRVRIEPEPVEVSESIPAPSPIATADVQATQPSQELPSTFTPGDEEMSDPATSSLPTRLDEMPPSSDASLIPDLSALGTKVRLIKSKYSNRAASGLYTDPFAKRRTGKGRPRNAYIATFRLPKLTTLEWFTPEAPEEAVETRQVSQAAFSAVPQNVADQRDATVTSKQPESVNQILDVADVAPDISESVRPTTAEQSQTQSSGDAEGELIPNDEGSDPSIAVRDTETAPTRIVDQSELDDNVLQPARPTAGWNAINKQPLPAYQSPYATPDTPESTPVLEASPEIDHVETTTQDSEDESQIQGVFGPIKEVNTTNQSARKVATYMGTKTGGGSQKMFRHTVIMQIIDLCNGVYPMHGEIGRPFITLWRRQYPNVAPPNSSTVLSNLRDMIADPDSGLKKFSFLIRLRQSAGLKKKDMVVYSHLTPTSPQVTRLAYKMANYSSNKAHQYYPEEIRHLVTDESFYVPMTVARKDESISLERLNPSLQHKIKEANLERRRRYYHKQKDEESARNAQNAGVEAPLKRTSDGDGQPRARRARLASLNDKNKRYRRAPLSATSTGPMDPEIEESIAETPVDDRQHGLTWTEPLISHTHHDAILPQDGTVTQSEAIQESRLLGDMVATITLPFTRFYALNGTFSTEFGIVRKYEQQSTISLARTTVSKAKSTKRVRIVEPVSQRPAKKTRLDIDKPQTIIPDDPVDSSEDSENPYSSSTSSSSSDSEDDIPLMQLSTARAKARTKAEAKAKAKAKRDAKARRDGSRKDPPPTLLERLTGLTGDPSAEVHFPPKPRLYSQKKYQTWNERKKAKLRKLQRKFPESYDPVDRFKKLFCMLIIASSLAGEAGHLDWNMVERMYDSKTFNLANMKALWIWIQANMLSEVAELKAQFEARFLSAYENNELAAIEDPSTYDWANLVRWAMHTCVYPEISLPVWGDALQHFIVDLSSFEALDRPKWHRERIADRVRTHVQLQYSFRMLLHQSHGKAGHINVTELKARSWIRANTATPQAVYESGPAHEKLRTIDDSVLAKVVGEYVDRKMLRMRKLKRLLPGRNYTFTASVAKQYGRTFQLSDFMTAVTTKKKMDAAFMNEDPERRYYSISRTERDGNLMAIMSLLGDSKVKLVPQTPSVNNEFGAPLPRLSVWGFMEGDYIHRGIDRQRLFWDIHVVPTETYQYGNPLRPSQAPSGTEMEKWSPLPQPPLPGKSDPDALIPIWSSMDGQNVTWPWWYRILNLVLQPLIFQPGATVQDIHANCDEYTTEVFEIELVLQWLVAVDAVSQVTGGGYVTRPGVWAVFGEVLYDMDDDWLNAHVKRKNEKHKRQQWRDQYNSRFSAMHSREAQRRLIDVSDESDVHMDDGRHKTMDTDIMRHPKEQYAIMRGQLATAPLVPSDTGQIMETAAQSPTASGLGSGMQAAEPQSTGSPDIEIQDADAGADADADADDDDDDDANANGEMDADGDMG
jgi:hypothetical protein